MNRAAFIPGPLWLNAASRRQGARSAHRAVAEQATVAPPPPFRGDFLIGHRRKTPARLPPPFQTFRVTSPREGAWRGDLSDADFSILCVLPVDGSPLQYPTRPPLRPRRPVLTTLILQMCVSLIRNEGRGGRYTRYARRRWQWDVRTHNLSGVSGAGGTARA